MKSSMKKILVQDMQVLRALGDDDGSHESISALNILKKVFPKIYHEHRKQIDGKSSYITDEEKVFLMSHYYDNSEENSDDNPWSSTFRLLKEKWPRTYEYYRERIESPPYQPAAEAKASS